MWLKLCIKDDGGGEFDQNPKIVVFFKGSLHISKCEWKCVFQNLKNIEFIQLYFEFSASKDSQNYQD